MNNFKETAKQNENIEEIINKLNRKSSTRDIIIILLAIIIIMLLCWLGIRIGKIGYTETSVNDVEDWNVSLIRVLENDMEITKNTKLNIFNNVRYGGEKIIAPHATGVYKFVVKNQSNHDIKYDIQFSDMYNHFVNMKYKLKIDNVYIRGNKDKYLDIKDLNVNDIIFPKDSINVYTVEWYWEDNDEKDTFIGNLDSDEYYTLNLRIDAHDLQK